MLEQRVKRNAIKHRCNSHARNPVLCSGMKRSMIGTYPTTLKAQIPVQPGERMKGNPPNQFMLRCHPRNSGRTGPTREVQVPVPTLCALRSAQGRHPTRPAGPCRRRCRANGETQVETEAWAAGISAEKAGCRLPLKSQPGPPAPQPDPAS